MRVINELRGNWDASMLVGYEWDIGPRVKMTARVYMDFKDIFGRGSNYLDYKMLHMRGTLMISYSFLRYDENPFKKK